ncbi:MAG: putative lipid II flippase FtsW [Patescibacteria group bacterium]|nr:putative lipid II flippase FtsW [Patescibacteria group bacterium]
MSLERFRKHVARPDYFLIMLVFILAVFGLVMIYSSSVVSSYEIFGYNSYYLNKQAISLVIGVVVWFIFAKIDYRFWQKYALWMLVATLILLILVFVPGIGKEIGGAHRWIDIGPLFFQPSEIAKLTLIIYLAAWLSKKGEGVKDLKKGFLPFVIILAIIAFLIIKEPDMGTLSVIAGIATIIFFAAGASWQHLTLGLASIIGFFVILIKSAPYRMQRFLTFLNPEKEALGAGYHINQALLAIGTGGLFGLGFGQSKQKYLYLPQAHSDSIFAIIMEELGFLRASLVIIAFILIAWRGFKIAKNAPDAFSRLMAVGITSWIVIQAFINIAAMTGIMPLTGVPLPFISYGGSSLVILLAAVGILTNISKQANK